METVGGDSGACIGSEGHGFAMVDAGLKGTAMLERWIEVLLNVSSSSCALLALRCSNELQNLRIARGHPNIPNRRSTLIGTWSAFLVLTGDLLDENNRSATVLTCKRGMAPLPEPHHVCTSGSVMTPSFLVLVSLSLFPRHSPKKVVSRGYSGNLY